MSAIDKAAKIAAAKAAKAKEQRRRVSRLDPKFPFRVIPCDLTFFGVTADPVPSKT